MRVCDYNFTRVFWVVCAFFFFQNVFSQTTKEIMRIELNNGTIVEYNVDDVNQIVFDFQEVEQEESLAGTTWKVVSVSSQSEDWAEFEGFSVTFNNDGSLTFSPTNSWTYAKWSLNNGFLKFILGEGYADDCIVGNIIFNGDIAVWNCYWEDVDGKWSDKDDVASHATITVQKQ